MSCSAWLDARQLLPVTDELARKRDGHARPVAIIPQGKPCKRRDLVSKCQCSRKAERIVWAGSPRWVRHGNLRRRGCQAAKPQLAAILCQHQPKRRSEAAIAGVRQPQRLGNAAEVWASWHSQPKRQQPKRERRESDGRAALARGVEKRLGGGRFPTRGLLVPPPPPPPPASACNSPKFVTTMSHSDVSAITAMIGAELLLATVNATVKWAGSWPSVRIMLVRFSIDTHTHMPHSHSCHMHMQMCMCMRLSLSLSLTLTLLIPTLRSTLYPKTLTRCDTVHVPLPIL